MYVLAAFELENISHRLFMRYSFGSTVSASGVGLL